MSAETLEKQTRALTWVSSSHDVRHFASYIPALDSWTAVSADTTETKIIFKSIRTIHERENYNFTTFIQAEMKTCQGITWAPAKKPQKVQKQLNERQQRPAFTFASCKPTPIFPPVNRGWRKRAMMSFLQHRSQDFSPGRGGWGAPLWGICPRSPLHGREELRKNFNSRDNDNWPYQDHIYLN